MRPEKLIYMDKKLNKVLIVSCMLFSFICCAQKQKFVSCSPEDFSKLLMKTPGIQLVDVRRPEEFEAGHIDKAVLINVQSSDFVRQALSQLDKSKPVAVYCRSGRRSKDAAGLLVKEGFTVYDLNTGYLGWMEYQSR